MATIKQLKAIENVVENRGNVSKAMLDAGYDETTAKNPKNLTESRAWQDLMDKYLDDKRLVRVHAEGLGARRKRAEIVDRDDKGRPVYQYFDEPDYFARHKYLETAYKIKDKLNAEDTKQPTNITYNLFNKPEIKVTVAQLEEKIKRQLMIQDVQETQKPVEA